MKSTTVTYPAHIFAYAVALLALASVISGFSSIPTIKLHNTNNRNVNKYYRNEPCLSHSTATSLHMIFGQSNSGNSNADNAKLQKDGIDKVVAALRKDKDANQELGKLEKVTNILGFGTRPNDVVAVRFNASFRRGGMGRSVIPLPFGLGQSNVAEGRGTMVGQVKASVNVKTGKVLECSVFRDLGYGRAFNLKV